LQIDYAVIEQSSADNDSSLSPATAEPQTAPSCRPRSADLISELARRFLHLQNFALDRFHRYEVALWRQMAQILFTLDALDRRKPQERALRSPPNCQRAPHIQRRRRTLICCSAPQTKLFFAKVGETPIMPFVSLRGNSWTCNPPSCPRLPKSLGLFECECHPSRRQAGGRRCLTWLRQSV
jgi:hypothetical protein